jgi:hypothetical protein
MFKNQNKNQSKFNLYNKNIEQRIKNILLINTLENENTKTKNSQKNNSQNEMQQIKISSTKDNVNDIIKKLNEYTELSDDEKKNIVVLFDFEFKDMYVKDKFIDEFSEYYTINIFENNEKQLTIIHSIGLIFLNTSTHECNIYQIHMPYYSNIELLKLFNIMKNKHNTKITKAHNTNYNDYFMNLNEYYEYRNYNIPKHHENSNIYIEYDVRFNIYKDYEKRIEFAYFVKLSNTQIKRHIDYFNEHNALHKSKIGIFYNILYNILTSFTIINKGDKDFFIFINSLKLFSNKFKILSFNKKYLDDIKLKDIKKGVKINKINRIDIDSIYSKYGYNKMEFNKIDYWDARDEILRIKKNDDKDINYNNDKIDINNKEIQKNMKLLKLQNVYNKYILQRKGKKTKIIKYIEQKLKIMNHLYTKEELLKKFKNNEFISHIALEDTMMTFFIFLGYKNF